MRAVAIKALQCGSIPQHIGLIMDGNRRYGRKVHVGNGKGYYLGYETLEEVRARKASSFNNYNYQSNYSLTNRVLITQCS